MTKNQFREMAQDFAKFAGMQVSYKVFNIHYEKDSRVDYKRHKYNHKEGTLRGVGIEGNSEHFIIQQIPYGGLSAIHYKNITWPL